LCAASWRWWRKRSRGYALFLALTALATSARADDGTPFPKLDLTGPFGTASRWTLTATRGAPMPDPSGLDTSIPGVITLCLRTSARPGCARDLLDTPPIQSGDDPAWSTTRQVDRVAILSLPVGKRLLVETSGPHSANDSHWRLTQVLAYDRGEDRFQSLFARTVGSNNNQEIRVIEHGSLAGDIVTAEPTSDAPYGYWITVVGQTSTTSTTYRPRLRFRSATHYGDGNPLAVIDAEMLGILRRLGKPHPLPSASRACPIPHLHEGALWCTRPPETKL
jgi:hypothetical protein